MDNKIIVFSQKVFKNYDIKVSPKDLAKVTQQFAIYIDALIFNVVSSACLLAVLNNSKKLTNETLMMAKKHLLRNKFKFIKLSKNTSMKGGTFNTAGFYGNKEPMYSAGNETSDLLNVNFDKGVLRPQIGQDGGCGCNAQSGGKVTKDTKDYVDKFISSQMKKMLKYHDVKSTKKINDELGGIIKSHLNKKIVAMIKCVKPLSLSSINKLLK